MDGYEIALVENIERMRYKMTLEVLKDVEHYKHIVDIVDHQKNLIAQLLHYQDKKSKTGKKMVCAHCGSENVLRDAYAQWDVPQQAWVLHNTFDNSLCEYCDGECNINEVEITS